MDQRKPDPPRMHEHKIHARSIEATRDEPQRITFEVIARDGAETYRMGRIKLSVRGCPVIIAAGGALRLAVPFRCEVDEDAWALLEATQRETVEAVSPYVSDASGQMVWNAALDGVASMAEATTDVSEFHAALKSEGWTATFVTPNGDRYVATGDDPQTGVTP